MLVHGPEISQILDLPIGLYSEESQEAQKNPESKAASYYKDIQDQCNGEPIPLSPSKI